MASEPCGASPAPAAGAASGADLAENARLRHELAAVRHRLWRRADEHGREALLWRDGALRLELRLAECAFAERSRPAEDAARSGRSECSGPRPVAQREELRQHRVRREREQGLTIALREKSIAADAQLLEVQARCRGLEQELCDQAAALLMRQSANPVDAFVSSLSRLDEESLRWVRQSLDVQASVEGASRPSLQVTSPQARKAQAMVTAEADAKECSGSGDSTSSQEGVKSERATEKVAPDADCPAAPLSRRRARGVGRGLSRGSGATGAASWQNRESAWHGGSWRNGGWWQAETSWLGGNSGRAEDDGRTQRR